MSADLRAELEAIQKRATSPWNVADIGEMRTCRCLVPPRETGEHERWHAQIAAPVPAERPGATSRAYQTPTGAPAGSLGSRIRFIALTMPPDRHVWLSELAADADRMEVERDKARTQADRAHKAVHDTLRWVEGKERDVRRASDKANEQVYQQVARMLRRAFDRAGTAETGETTT